MNWYAARNDGYNPPIVRGMRRQVPHAQARARILDDDEIRAIWKAGRDRGAFGAIVRLALLTAQRRAQVVTMRWADMSIDGEWTIPKEPREKDSAGTLVLPDVGDRIIRAQPRLGDNPYVFAGRGDGPYRWLQPRQDALRRQAAGRRAVGDPRSAAYRALTDEPRRRASEHAERVMGHASPASRASMIGIATATRRPTR